MPRTPRDRAPLPLAGLLLAAAVASVPAVAGAGAGDVTDRLRNAGNKLATAGRPEGLVGSSGDPIPTGLTGRALNVWDLQAFDGKVYLGGGNTTTNPGPLNVWAYDVAGGGFGASPEAVSRNEAIENFRVLGGDLYLPYSDPDQPPGDGVYFQRRRPGEAGFTEVGDRSVRLAHVRDMVRLGDGTILAVGNSRNVTIDNQTAEAIAASTDGASAAVSRDGGASFTAAVDPTQINPYGNWYYSAFTYDGRAFATGLSLQTSGNFQAFEPIVEFDPVLGRFVGSNDGPTGGAAPRPGAVRGTDFFVAPDDPADRLQDPRTGEQAFGVVAFVRESVEFDGQLVYALATHSPFTGTTRRDFYRNSLDFLVKTSVDSAPIDVVFPDAQALGEDVLLGDGGVYALANRRDDDGTYRVYVYFSTDPAAGAWDEVLTFASDNLARSFEVVDDTFYFGLGYDELAGDAVGDAGALLSVQVPEPAAAAVLGLAPLLLRRRR